jgi:hypothetical protein
MCALGVLLGGVADAEELAERQVVDGPVAEQRALAAADDGDDRRPRRWRSQRERGEREGSRPRAERDGDDAPRGMFDRMRRLRERARARAQQRRAEPRRRDQRPRDDRRPDRRRGADRDRSEAGELFFGWQGRRGRVEVRVDPRTGEARVVLSGDGDRRELRFRIPGGDRPGARGDRDRQRERPRFRMFRRPQEEPRQRERKRFEWRRRGDERDRGRDDDSRRYRRGSSRMM